MTMLATFFCRINIFIDGLHLFNRFSLIRTVKIRFHTKIWSRLNIKYLFILISFLEVMIQVKNRFFLRYFHYFYVGHLNLFGFFFLILSSSFLGSSGCLICSSPLFILHKANNNDIAILRFFLHSPNTFLTSLVVGSFSIVEIGFLV